MNRPLADTGALRVFYERHPYPRPLTHLDRYRARCGRAARLVEYRLHWPARAYRDDASVLIAGCGTSQAAKHAMRWPDASVVGIDIGSTALRASEGLKRRHGLANLEVVQLELERARDLGRRFDRVVCTGVLHHLADPEAGLLALRDVLEPGGAMHLMVYAPYGRTGIYLLQEYCRRLGVGASSSQIRDLAAMLQRLPRDHPLVPLLDSSADFGSEAGMADALLHPQDRPYSVPELFEMVARCGLQFGRWLRQAPYLPACGALAASPHRALMQKLGAPEQYAAVELFRGTMARHSAIIYRSDFPGDCQPIRFDDEQWLDYVPIRIPQTVCVLEHLPRDAAGVLINRTHTYRDIYLPVNAIEKRWFEKIDGRRSIGELVPEDDARGGAKAFFERLWEHDQVVFDASGDRSIGATSACTATPG